MKNVEYILTESMIGIITLNSPLKKNKIDSDVLAEITLSMQNLLSENAAAIILTGKDGVFSAGYDIEKVADDFSLDSEYSSAEMNIFEKTLLMIEEYDLPTLAMIDGFCIGGAFEMACAFDFRIASDKSRFGITPSKIGLVYPLSGIKRVTDVVGSAFAREMFLTGNLYSSERMYERGFLNYVLKDDPEPWCINFIEKVTRNSSVSIRGMKKTMRELSSGKPDEKLCRELTEESLKGNHLREGKEAFFEKRKPFFK